MAKPPNQDLINRLMAEMEEQKEIIEKAKDANRIIRELNRMIAVLGGEAPLPKTTERRSKPIVEANEEGGYTCPECGRDDFQKPQGLGIHRKIVHGVEGSYKFERGVRSGEAE